jgi:hypothetical protein
MAELTYITWQRDKENGFYKATDIYLCKTCLYKWRGDPGPQGCCQKCGGINIKWLTFETDWIYDPAANEWLRREAQESVASSRESG